MQGLMQDWPLLISRIIEHGARCHGSSEIVTYTVEGEVHRYTFAECHMRSKKLAQALERFGIRHGDRVATLAWNTYRHVEAWYGISGMGAVTHTVNPKLFSEQIAYIINHAEDRLLFLDLSFVSMVEALAERLENIEAFVIMTDPDHMPATSLTNVICYETLLEAEDGAYSWPVLDENAAAGLCYTSGTTGNPKGVLYSHRSNFLHTWSAAAADTLGATARDTIMPIVPMFHANAWGIPYLAFALGARLVLNGPNFDGQMIHQMIQDQAVTITAAVPTLWLGLLDHLRKSGLKVDSLKNVIIGGAAAPANMIEAFETEYDVQVCHAWGMTETSPIGTIGTLNGVTAQWSRDEQLKLKVKQGRPPLGVELKVIDDDGKELPKDGKTFGHLMVRGPWVARRYFRDEGGDMLDPQGWFDTGDVATLDPNGYMQITDRAKDVIKSGGEWISSIELENAAVEHPSVAEAAVIGLPHPKWDERPLLILVAADGATIDKPEILEFLAGKVAKWWLPDAIVMVDEIPHTATGKIRKTELREQFRDFELPTA